MLFYRSKGTAQAEKQLVPVLKDLQLHIARSELSLKLSLTTDSLAYADYGWLMVDGYLKPKWHCNQEKETTPRSLQTSALFTSCKCSTAHSCSKYCRSCSHQHKKCTSNCSCQGADKCNNVHKLGKCSSPNCTLDEIDIDSFEIIASLSSESESDSDSDMEEEGTNFD